MIRLILVRHGNTFEANQTPVQVGARTDLPLTQQGKNQAAQLAHFFSTKNISPKAIYAGTLKRQTQTAAILAHSPILIEKALIEIDYGIWEGLSSDQIQQKWKEEYDAWTLEGKWPAGIFAGSLEQHLADIEQWLNHLRKTYSSGDSVIGVTSNGIIRLFHPERHRAKELKVKTGHYCELYLSADSLIVESWNQSLY